MPNYDDLLAGVGESGNEGVGYDDLLVGIGDGAVAQPQYSPEVTSAALRLRELESSPESTDNLTEQIRRSNIELARKDFEKKAGLLTQAAQPALPESSYTDILRANNNTFFDRRKLGLTGTVESVLSWLDSATSLQDNLDKWRAINLHKEAINTAPESRTPEQKDFLSAVYGRADIRADDKDFDFGDLNNFVSSMEYTRQSRAGGILSRLRDDQAEYQKAIDAERKNINTGDNFLKGVVDTAQSSAQDMVFDIATGRVLRAGAGGRLATARGADAVDDAASAAIRAKAMAEATGAGALASMAVQVYGQTRAEGIAEGLSPAEAEARARWHTAIEWATERLPLDMILKGKFDKGAILKALRASGAEGLSEIVATGLQSGYDHFNIEGKEITLGELVKQMAHAAATGALVGGSVSLLADATGTSVKQPGKAETAEDVMREIGERYKASPTVKPEGYSAVDAEMAAAGEEVAAALDELPEGASDAVKYRTVREIMLERGITPAKAPRTTVERLVAAHRNKKQASVSGGTEGDITDLGADLRAQAGLDETVVDEPVAQPKPVRFAVDESIEPLRKGNEETEVAYLQRAASDLDEMGRVDRRSFNPDFHSLSDAVAFEGGLDRGHLGGEVDIKTANAGRVGRPVVRAEGGGGLTPDHMAERLHELGFRAPGGGRLDPNSLMELLADEAIGRRHFSIDKAYTGRFDEDRGFTNQHAGGDATKLAGAIRKYLAGGELGIRQRRALKEIIEHAYDIGDLQAVAGDAGAPEAANAVPIAQALADAGFDRSDEAALAAAREAYEAGVPVQDIAQAIRAAGGDPSSLDVSDEQAAGQQRLSAEDRAVESAAGPTAVVAQAAIRLTQALDEVARSRKGRAMRTAGAVVPKRNAGNFSQPYDREVDSSMASAGEAAWRTGATPEQAAAMFDALFPRAHVDATTGFYKAEQRFETAQRAIEYVNNSKARGFYVEIDLSNLGGLNAKLGHSEANKVYRRMAGIVSNMLSVRLSKGDPAFDQVNFRHGGDEMSFFVFGENIDQSSIEAVLRSAQERVWTYARSVGIHEIPHAKQKDNEQKIGVNFYFGVAQIEKESTPESVFKVADKRVEDAKEEPGYGYRKRKAARPARTDAGGAGGADGGNTRRGGANELAGEPGADRAGAPGEAGAAGGAGRDGDAEVRLEAGQAGRDPALDEAGGQVEERRRGDDRTTDLFGGKTAEEEAAQRLKDAEVEREAKQKRDAERAAKMSDGPLFDGTAEQTDVLAAAKNQAPVATERFAAGAALTKEERKQVLASLTDVYVANGHQKELRVRTNGEEYYAYPHAPELFEKSDITGAMVRYYVTMPDGRKAHPTELFPDYTQAEIDAVMAKRETERKNARAWLDAAVFKNQFDSAAKVAAFYDAEHAKNRGVSPAKDRIIYTKGGKYIAVPADYLDAGKVKSAQLYSEVFSEDGWKVAGKESAVPVEKPDETEASAILDAADVRGKDRLEAMEKFRAGTYTLDDLKGAYPPKAAVQPAPAAEKKAAKVTPQIASERQLNNMIAIAADSIGELRSVDVDRVLSEAPAHFRLSLAQHIKSKRKDLAGAVDSAMEDIASEGSAVEPAQDEKPPAAPGAIQDFGEKLGGARKDKAAAQREAIEKEFSDEEIATLPLSKVWPKGEVDDIEDTYAAAVAHAARQEVPAKPRQTGKVRVWVQKVKVVRGLAQYILRGTISKERFSEMLRAGGRALEHFAAKVDVLQGIDRAQWDRIGAVEEYPDAYRYGEGATRIPAPMVSVEIDGRRKRYEGVTSVADAMDAIRADLGEAAAEKQMKFEVRGSNDQWRINKVGDPLYRPLKSFTDSKEALAYVRNNNAELVAAWEALKDRQNVKQTDVRRDTNRQRTAQNWRNGKDVTPQQFIDEFGFRGVEFGNWVGQGKSAKERQGMLNEAYDALMDLADITGIPPKAISLSGSLGLGFGSRGHGWASAHFEPGTLVINLTKTRGAGALAHEWFHALDNYFQRERIAKGERPLVLDNKGSGDFITYAPENYYVHKASGRRLPEKAFKVMIEGGRDERYGTLGKSSRDPAGWEFRPGVRTEVAERFVELVKALNESPMAKRSRRIDKGKSEGYWSSIIEMGARSFENYVIHKMMLKGYHNDYLANVVAVEEFQRDADFYPYLTAGELAPVAEAFDALFATTKTRAEADGRMAIYEPAKAYDGDAVHAKRKEVDSGKASNLQRRRVSAAQEQGDLFTASAVPAGEQRTAAVADIYHVTVEHEEVGRIDVGHEVIDSPEKAAWALRHLGRRAQEQMVALVTDKDGRPLAIISHTTGLRSSSQVDAGGIAGAIVSQPGAKHVWLAHNHPGGDPTPSAADRNITNKIADLLSGTGVVAKGHVVVGSNGDAWMFTNDKGGEPHGYPVSEKKADAPKSVAVVERVITARDHGGIISRTSDAERIAAGLNGDGVMLVDSQLRVVGFVPMTSDDMASLRATSDPAASTPLYRLLAALDKTNADAVIIVGGKKEASENVEKFGNAAGVRVLDWISGGKSKAAVGEFGGRFVGEAFFSLSTSPAAGGVTAGSVREEIETLRKAIPGLDTVIVQSVNDLPAYIVDYIERRESRGDLDSTKIEGVFDPIAGRCYVVADNLSSAKRGAEVALHENVAHYGTRILLGDRHEAVMLEIERSFRGRPDFEEVRARYGLKNKLSRSERAQAADEFVARLSESGTLAAMAKAKPLGPVGRLFRAIREILQRAGLVDWNDADIERLLARAVDAVNSQRAVDAGERVLALSMSPSSPAGSDSSRQFKDTERAYGGKSAYEKAKAEGRTKLNYRQWVQVRTPNFKNWFGDWEALRAQDRLVAMKPVQVRVPDEWRGLSVKDLRDLVRESLEELRASGEPLRHPEIGDVSVTRAGVKKALSEGADPAKLLLLGDLRDAFESSFFAGAKPAKDKASNIAAFEKLLIKLDVDGTELVAAFSVQRLTDGRQFYNAVALEDGQKKTPVASPGDTPISGERATPANTGVSDFVRRQLDRVNPEEVSKVVDPTTGEPLVVYHGTDASFDEFAIPGGPEPGVFFTPSAVDASDYSERFGEYADSPNVMPVFLSMPDARIVDGKRKTFSTVNKEAFASGNADGLIIRNVVDGFTGAGDVYIAARGVQIKSATGNNGDFDPNNPDIRFSLSGAGQQNVNTAKAGKEARSNKGEWDALYEDVKSTQAVPESRAMIDRVRDAYSHLNERNVLAMEQGIIDQFASIKALEKAKHGDLLDADKSAWKAALLTQNLSGVMAAIINNGQPKFDGKWFSKDPDAESFSSIFEPLAKEPGLLRAWEHWAGAVRAKRLLAEGRERNYSQEQVDRVLAFVDARPELAKLFNETHRRWREFNKRTLDMAEAAGVVDPVERKLWENDDYVPFHRVIEDQEDSTPRGPLKKRGLEGQSSGIRRLAGSDAKVNIFESMLLNTMHLVDASYKNVAMQRISELADGIAMERIDLDWKPVSLSGGQLAEALKKSGVDVGSLSAEQREAWLKVFTRVRPEGNDVVSVMRNGKREWYRVTDPLLLASITAIGPEPYSLALEILGAPKRLLTTTVTAMPGFMIANSIRDTLSTWQTISLTGLPGEYKTKPVTDAIRGAVRSLKDSDDQWALMFSGASSSGFYNTHPADVRQQMREINGMANTLSTPKKAWRAWMRFGLAFENANRLAVYENVKKAGGSDTEAAFQAMDVINFSKRGSWKTVRFLVAIVPFLNARIQGQNRLYRGFRHNKTSFVLKGLALSAVSLLVMAMNEDDERYWALEEWDRDIYWHFWVGRQHFRVPKPFEAGAIFGTTAERFYAAISGKDDGKDLQGAAMRFLQSSFGIQIPQAALPLSEVAMNYSTFRQSPIMPSYMADFYAPEDQYDPDKTSLTSRAAAELMPDFAPDFLRSPMKLEHLLRGYFGTLGTELMKGSDWAFRNALDMPDTPTMEPWQYPIVGRFWRTGYDGTKYVGEFYDMLGDAEEEKNGVDKLTDEMMKDRAAKRKEERRYTDAELKTMREARTKMSEWRSEIDEILMSTTIHPDVKRDRISALQKKRNDKAKQTLEKFAEK